MRRNWQRAARERSARSPCWCGRQACLSVVANALRAPISFDLRWTADLNPQAMPPRNAPPRPAAQRSAVHCRYLLRRSPPARPPFVRRAADEYLLAAGRLRAFIPRARCRRESGRGGIARAVVAMAGFAFGCAQGAVPVQHTDVRSMRSAVYRRGAGADLPCVRFTQTSLTPRRGAHCRARAWRGRAYPSRPSPPGVLAGTAGACCATKSFACGRSRRNHATRNHATLNHATLKNSTHGVPLQHAPCGHATCRPRHAASDMHNAVRRAACDVRRNIAERRRRARGSRRGLHQGGDCGGSAALPCGRLCVRPARARACAGMSLALPPTRQLLHAPAAASARRARTPAPRESIDSACARSCTGTTR